MADSDTYEQADYDPSIDKESSKPWLNLVDDAKKAMEDWQTKSDGIDKLYASLERQAKVRNDREFALFWANLQVLAPSVYSRPPVPVVVPRFRSRNPVARTASEMLERCATVTFEMEDIDSTMRLLRDDLVRLSRGAPWVDYEDKIKKGKKAEKLCIKHLDRHDFICSPSRKWKEVDLAGKCEYLTRDEMRARFQKHSGDAYEDAVYEEVTKEQKDRGNRDPLLKAAVWELWSISEDCVVWVTKGVDVVLERSKPYLDLEGFFPCPRPAYGTLQPASLVPVPDMLYYKDQLEEINELTARIGALAEALRVKGFYASGGEIGAAVEAAMKNSDNGAIMVPISNWAALGGNSGDPIIWLPIDMIAKTIAGLVELRKQLIDDVYQITGLSDIMRGQTQASETLGAQQLKSQYGSIRVRDRQDELVRVARDLTRIVTEIMAENFDKQTLLDMSQMDLPTDAEIKKQINDLEKQGQQVVKQAADQAKQAAADPANQQKAQQDPQGAQQALGQLQQQAQEQVQQIQQQIQKIGETVTIDQVMKLLRDQKLRPFALDIETDSTIAPDENAQKQRATEFITAVGGFINQALPAVQAMPQIAPLMADSLKYVASQFRAGRQLDASIDEFADSMKQMAAQPKANPEANAMAQQQQIEGQKLELEKARTQADVQSKQADTQMKSQASQQDAQIKAATADHQAKMREIETSHTVQSIQTAAAQSAQKHAQDMQAGALQMQLTQAKIAQATTATQNNTVKTASDIQAKAQSTAIAAQAADNKAEDLSALKS